LFHSLREPQILDPRGLAIGGNELQHSVFAAGVLFQLSKNAAELMHWARSFCPAIEGTPSCSSNHKTKGGGISYV